MQLAYWSKKQFFIFSLANVSTSIILQFSLFRDSFLIDVLDVLIILVINMIGLLLLGVYLERKKNKNENNN